MAYTYQSRVEEYIKRELTDYEVSIFDATEPAIADIIDLYTGRTFDSCRSSKTTESHDGSVREIFLDTPCSSLTKVEYVDYYTNDKTLIDSTDYVTLPYNSSPITSIMLRSGLFTAGTKNVLVTGSFSDYDTVPDSIALAATIMCSNIISQARDENGAPLDKESIEGYSRSWASGNQLVLDNPTVKSTLDMYRKVLI